MKPSQPDYGNSVGCLLLFLTLSGNAVVLLFFFLSNLHGTRDVNLAPFIALPLLSLTTSALFLFHRRTQTDKFDLPLTLGAAALVLSLLVISELLGSR